MKTVSIALAAALTLPLATPLFAQSPAQFDVETVAPIGGTWTYQPFAGGSEARFTDHGAASRMAVRCNRAARTVSVVRAGVAAAAPAMSVWTSSLARRVPSRFVATGELIADLTAADPLLDAIAFSRGRFATGAAGAPLLALPVGPEVARVIEDCRI